MIKQSNSSGLDMLCLPDMRDSQNLYLIGKTEGRLRRDRLRKTWISHVKMGKLIVA